MPRVPVYNSPQVQSRPVGTPFAPMQVDKSGEVLAEAGAKAGNQIAQAGATLHKAFQEDRERADTVAAQALFNEFDAHATTVLHDRNTGLRTMRGHGAIQGSEKARESLDKRLQELAGRAPPSVRSRFEVRARDALNGYHRQIEQHVSKEIDFVTEQTYKATEQSALGKLSALPDDVDRDKVIADVESTIHDKATWLGVDTTTRELMVSDWRSQATAAVIDGFIRNEDAMGATAYFEGNKAQLGSRASDYGRKVKEYGRATLAAQSADAIMAAATDDEGRVDGVRAIQLAQQTEGFDEETKAKINALVEHRKGVADHIQKKKVTEVFGRILSSYDQGVSISDPRVATDRAWMEDPRNGGAEAWHAFMNELESKRDRSKREDTLADREAIQAFRNLEPRDQVETNIRTEFATVSNIARLKMEGIQKAARETLSKGHEAKDSDFRRMMREEMDGLRLKANDPGRQAMEADLWDWFDEYRGQNDGRYPPREEVKKKLGETFTLVKSSGVFGFFGRERYAGQVPPEERGDYKPLPADKQKSPTARQRAGGRVRVKKADGSAGSIPAANLDAWLKANPGGKAL